MVWKRAIFLMIQMDVVRNQFVNARSAVRVEMSQNQKVYNLVLLQSKMKTIVAINGMLFAKKNFARLTQFVNHGNN
jgi:hypothetical protein